MEAIPCSFIEMGTTMSNTFRVLFFCAFIAVTGLGGAGKAAAQTIKNFSGTFAAPAAGTFTGSYTHNGVAITSGSVSVSLGTADDGVTLVTPITIPLKTNTTTNVIFAPAGDATGARGFVLRVDSTVFDPAAMFSSGREGTCNTSGCSAPPALRTIATASLMDQVVASVPTLSEWAMIAFGLILAGGAALYIQRRQMIA